MKLLRYVLLSLFAATMLEAQPVVSQGGVLNSASFTRDGLPGDGLAQGGMFAVFGQGLGPAGLLQAPSIPLTTELGGTSITVTVGGASVSPFLLFTSSGQLAAILPSDTPVGTGTLTVTFNGQTSPAVSVKVVANAFGMFARNQAGFGPAIVQNFISATDAPVNGLNQAAQPGQVLILWGTGLGAIQGSDGDVPPVGSLPVSLEVIVGGSLIAQPLYAGRAPGFPGVDQINFALPAGIEGCYVSVAVRVNGVISNHGTIAVNADGRYCDDVFTPEQLQLAEQQGSLRVGAVTLVTGAGLEPSAEAEGGEYSLAVLQTTTLTFIGFETHVAAQGSCVVWPEQEDFFHIDPLLPRELDGGDVTFTTAAGTLVEGVEIPEDFFGPGLVTARSTAGAEVGAFDLSVTLPQPGTLTSAIPGSVNRSQPLTVSWTGVDATTDMVLILGRSQDQARGVGRTFVCSADAAAGSFTVGTEVLESLPTSAGTAGSEEAAGVLLVGSARRADAGRVAVDGVDAGFFAPVQFVAGGEVGFE